MKFANIPFPPHLVAEAYQVDYPKGYLPPASNVYYFILYPYDIDMT